MNKLVLTDGQVINVITVNGEGRFIQNANRDTLIIRVPVDELNLDELKNIFKDKALIDSMKYLNEENEELNTMEHYTMYISCSNVSKEVRLEPGVIAPPTYEEYNQVEIAQVTYIELMLEQLLGIK